MSLTKLSLGGNNLYMTSLYPPSESLVSDIPVGDGNVEKLFLRGNLMCGDRRELEELEAIKEAEEAAIAEAEAAAAEAAAEVAMDLFGDDNEDDKVKKYQKCSTLFLIKTVTNDINRMFLAVSCYLRHLD
jgi:hypothetical protein